MTREASSAFPVEIGCPHCRRVFSTAAAPGFIVYCPFCAREISIPDFVQDVRERGIRLEDDEPTSFVDPKEQSLMPWFILGVVVTGVLAMGFYLVHLYPSDTLIRMVVIWFVGTVLGFAFGRMTTRKTSQ